MASVRVTVMSLTIFFLPNRPKWFPTMTRTAHTLSPMCPRLLGYTRYLPEGPPALLPSWMSTLLLSLLSLLAHTPLPLPTSQPHFASPLPQN